MSLCITIETIPHTSHRYPTVGDWIINKSPAGEVDLHIMVSELGDWRHEALVAFHELAEVLQCIHDGVTEEAVNAFDIAYEQAREKGLHSNTDEPGDDPSAPYRAQHFLATSLERLLAAALDVDWRTYETELESLP